MTKRLKQSKKCPSCPLVQVPYSLCFETFASELRIRIIEALMSQSLSVNQLSKKLKVEQSRLSHSLRMLKLCSYVDVTQSGKERIYSLKPELKNGLDIVNPKANIFQVIHQHAHTMCVAGCKKQVEL